MSYMESVASLAKMAICWRCANERSGNPLVHPEGKFWISFNAKWLPMPSGEPATMAKQLYEKDDIIFTILHIRRRGPQWNKINEFGGTHEGIKAIIQKLEGEGMEASELLKCFAPIEIIHAKSLLTEVSGKGNNENIIQ